MTKQVYKIMYGIFNKADKEWDEARGRASSEIVKRLKDKRDRLEKLLSEVKLDD
jgi:hypothetical protein